MDALLLKIFATALTFSQVATAPDTLKTHFDPEKDRQQVTDLLRAGCEHVRQSFDLESINLDDLIATAMEDSRGGRGRASRISRYRSQRSADRLSAILQERTAREFSSQYR
jgi:penicillin-binding protein 1A